MSYLHKVEGGTRRNGHRSSRDGQHGKVGWILLWLLGIPLPVLAIIYLFMH